MSVKKETFLNEILSHGCAVLVGPMLEKNEGDFPQNLPLLLVDGGFDKCLEHGLLAKRSTFSVGDGDSSKAQLDEKLSPKKDFSDLSYALDLLPHSIKKIILYGFLGGRRDHEISNFGEVHRFLKNKAEQSQVNFSDKILVLSSGKWRLTHFGPFSLMALDRPTVLLTGEIEYQLIQKTKLEPMSSLGLSNNSKGEFYLETDGPVFIYGAGVKIKSE